MDPLSITASVAGLVSLGLTVSGGLIQYCRAYRSQDTDLAQLAQHAQELESFLNMIENRTSGPQKPSTDIDDSLKKSRDTCDACLLDFKLITSKYTRLKSSKGLRERSRRLVHHLKYPFDKEKFDALRSQLQEFNIRLLGHLQLINLDLTRDLRSEAISESTKIAQAVESMGLELKSSISNTEQAVTNSIHHGVDQLESSFQRYVIETEKNITTSLDGNFSAISSQVASLSENQNSQALLFRSHLDQALELQLKQLHAIFSQAHAKETAFREAGATGATHTRWDQSLTRKPSSQTSVPNVFDSLCSCPRARRRGLTMQHQQGCIYSFANRKKRTFAMTIRAFKRQITETWQFEYSQLAWWRDLQIHRNLTLRAVVDERHAPAFLAIRQLIGKINDKSFNQYPSCPMSTPELQEAIQNCLTRLRQAFANGKGWPTDIMLTGGNLLNEACYILYHVQPSQVVVAANFLFALVQIGVPITNDQNSTPLDYLLPMELTNEDYSTMALLVDNFLNMGALLPHRPYLYTLPILQLNIPELYEPFVYSKLSHAVLHRNEHDVICLLRNDHSVLNERSALGRTVLHLATSWPRGLSILIEHGGDVIPSVINIQDIDGGTALDFAIKLYETDSVELLLNVGARVTDGTFFWLANIKNIVQAEKISCIVAESLVRQRRDLLQLALSNLLTKEINKFGLQEDSLLDEKAFDVVEALRHQDVSVPSTYDCLQPGSIYMWPSLTSLIAQKLFDAGFHETNTAFRGYYPLMCRYGDNVSVWFEDHGASLYTPIPIPDEHFDASSDADRSMPIYPTIHFLMRCLGERRWVDLPKEISRQLSRLLNDKISDPCICYCTGNGIGCTSASKYISHSSNQFKRRNLTLGETVDDDKYFEIQLYELLKPRIVERAVNENSGHQVAVDIIRVITFDMLGMRHTCCKYERVFDPRYDKGDLLILMDPEDIEEIREEDRYLAAQLETLMEEFEVKFRELNVPLSQFVESYWSLRIREVVRGRDELSAEDLHAIRETGVVLGGA